MAPADRSVASAASVRSDLALDFVLLGASVPPKKQNGGLLERKGLLATAASLHFVSSPTRLAPQSKCSVVNIGFSRQPKPLTN